MQPLIIIFKTYNFLKRLRSAWKNSSNIKQSLFRIFIRGYLFKAFISLVIFPFLIRLCRLIRGFLHIFFIKSFWKQVIFIFVLILEQLFPKFYVRIKCGFNNIGFFEILMPIAYHVWLFFIFIFV
jgi:hypothetical protein